MVFYMNVCLFENSVIFKRFTGIIGFVTMNFNYYNSVMLSNISTKSSFMPGFSKM